MYGFFERNRDLVLRYVELREPARPSVFGHRPDAKVLGAPAASGLGKHSHMNLTLFFGLLGGLLVLAFVANRLARKTAIPDVLVLMATGILLGPVLHLVDPSQFESVAHGFGTLALILILFEAGLDLNLRNTLRHLPGGIMIAVLSYGFSLAGCAFVLVHNLHIPLAYATLAGAALACISSSIILPVLQQMDLSPALASTLVVEASLSDALGVLTVGILLDLTAGIQAQTTRAPTEALTPPALSSHGGGAVAAALATGFLLKVLISLILALLAGMLWSRFLGALSEERFWRVLTFAAVLLVYAAADAAGGSDLFAVIAFGAALSNLPGKSQDVFELGWQKSRESKQLLAFHSELAFLVRSFFFVLLGLIVRFSRIWDVALPSLELLAVLAIARWLAVQMSRVALRDIDARGREIAVLLIPRGLITAVLVFEIVDAKGAALNFLVSLAFSLILLSNLLLLVGTFRARAMAAPASPPGDAVATVAPLLPAIESAAPEARDDVA
jgi:cell volume regulation protein A